MSPGPPACSPLTGRSPSEAHAAVVGPHCSDASRSSSDARVSIWAVEVATGKETCLGTALASPQATMELVRRLRPAALQSRFPQHGSSP